MSSATRRARPRWWVVSTIAVPLVFACIRTSSVQIIATAALAGLVGAGGLGVIVQSGLSNNQDDVILAGAIPMFIYGILRHS